jgi:hypothetical protein
MRGYLARVGTAAAATVVLTSALGSIGAGLAGAASPPASAAAAKPDAPRAGSFFACTIPTIFLGQLTPTQLYGGVPSAGTIAFNKIGAPAGWSYNALGFDTSTKYLYAVSIPGKTASYPAGDLLQINSAAAITNLGVISNDGDTYLAKHGETAGAFDSSNNFWVTSAGFPTVDEVDIATKPAKVLKKLTFTPALSWLSNDITYAAGYMWGMTVVSNTVVIQRLNLTTGAVNNFIAPKQIPVSGLGGASWTFGNGDLGFQSNTTGEIFEVSVANPTSAAPAFTLISHYQGPIAGANDDGASCAPNAVDLSAAMTAAPAGVGPGGQITWSVTITNNGPGISSGFAIQDPLPSTVKNITTSQGSAICSVTGTTVSCAEGQLALHAQLKMTISAYVTSSQPPATVTNKVTVVGNEKDPNPNNNSATTITSVSKGSPTITGTTAAGSGDTAGTVSFGDSATFTGGASPTGSITFKAYGPGDSTCSKSAAKTLTATAAVNGAGTYSSPLTALPAGSYQWVATYSGDNYNIGYSTTCGSEPFTVAQAAPPITSAAQPASGSAGGSYADKATLSGGDTPTGTVTFKLYGAGDTTCSNAPVFTDVENVTSGSATSKSQVLTTVGTYEWTSTYSGDANNAGASTSCGSDPVTVSAATVSIATTAQPTTGFDGNTFKDKATISGGSSPTGTITFNLYGQGDSTCSNAPIFTDVETLASGGATSLGFVISTAGTYEWTASYSGDPSNASMTSSCGSEPVTVQKPLPPSISTTASPTSGVANSTVFSDTATVSGGISPTGTLTFSLYPASDNCANTAFFTAQVAVSGNASYPSGNTKVSIPGNYDWQVTYSGDSSNAPYTTPCNSEPIVVQVAANCTTTWVGPQTGGLWSYAPNWSTDLIPGATSVVCIPALAGGAVVDYDGSNSASNTIKQLISDAPLELSGGSLMISDTTVADVSQLAGLSLVGGTFGTTGTTATASVVDTGGLSWTGGSFASPTSENPPPQFQIGTGHVVSIGPNASTLDNWLLSVASPIGIGGTIYMQAGGGISETGAATVTLADNADLYNYSSAGALTIGANATLTKRGTPGTATVSIPVNISGTVSVPSGELALGDGSSAPGASNPYNSGSLTGSTSVSTGAALLLDGVSLATGATDTGGGTTLFESYETVASTVTIATANVYQLSGETFDNGPLTIAGLLDVSGGTFDPLYASASDTVGSFAMSGGNLGDSTSSTDSLTDNGAFSWTGGSFNSIPTEATPTITVPASATTTISNPNGYLNNWLLSSAGPIGIAGYLYFESAGGISETGTATVTLADGSNIGQYGSAPGFLTIPAGSTLTKPNSPGTAVASVPVSISGNVTIPSGVLQLGYGSNPSGASAYNSGSISSAVEVDAGAQLTLNGVSFAAGATDTGAGTLVFENYLTIDPTVTLNVANLYQAGGTTIDEGDVSITGNMDVAGGAFIPLDGTYASGTFVVGSFTMTSGSFGSNNSSIPNNQTISVDVIDNGSFTWTGGSFETLSVTPAPVFEVAAGQSVEITNPSGYLDNWVLETPSAIGIVGNVYFSNSGGIDEIGTNNTAVTLADGTNITDQGSAGNLTIGAGAELTKSNTPGTATANVPINVAGKVLAPLGELVLGDGNNPNQNLSSTVTVNANSYLQLEGVNLAAGAVTSGAGTLLLYDNLTIDQSVTLHVNNVDEIGGTTTDNGPITVGGTFDVSAGTFIPNVPPAQGGTPPADTVGVFSMTGGQLGNTSATVDNFTDGGGFFWSGGSFHAQPSQSPIPTFTVPNASVTVTSPTGYLDDWSLQSPNAIGIAGSVYFSNHGFIDETGTSTVTVADGTNMLDEGSPGALTIGAGAALMKGDTPGIATIQVPVSIAGTVTVPLGELILGDGNGTGGTSTGTLSSTVTVDANAQLELNGVNLGVGATDTGAGSLILYNNLSIDRSVTLAVNNVYEEGGTTTDNGPVAVSGVFEVQGGTFTPLVPPVPPAGGSPPIDTIGSLTMTGGSIGPSSNPVTTDSFNVAGNFFWTGGSFNAVGSESPSPQINLQSATSTANITNPTGYLNNWILSTPGLLGIQGNVYFSNHGGIAETGSSTVTIGTGTNILDEGTPGKFSVAAGATVTVPNNYSFYSPPTINVPFDMSGTLQLGTGILDVTEQLTLEASAVVDETVGGPLTGIDQGQLYLTVAPVIQSGAALDITQASGFVPTSKEAFTVISDTVSIGSASFGANVTLPTNWTTQYSSGTPGYVKVVAP